MRQQRAAVLRLLVVVGLSACASTPRGSTELRSGAKRQNVITREEIAGADVLTAFDAITTLRAMMLRPRGVTPLERGTPPVYLDDLAVDQGVEILKRIHASSVYEICYLSAAEATLRYGTGHAIGVILVKTMPTSSAEPCS